MKLPTRIFQDPPPTIFPGRKNPALSSKLSSGTFPETPSPTNILTTQTWLVPEGCGLDGGVAVFPLRCFPEMWVFFSHVFLMLFERCFHFLTVLPDFISGSHNQGETGQNPQAPEKKRACLSGAARRTPLPIELAPRGAAQKKSGFGHKSGVLFWWDLLFVLT